MSRSPLSALCILAVTPGRTTQVTAAVLGSFY